LYGKENSEHALNKDGGVQLTESEDMNAGGNEQLSMIGETSSPSPTETVPPSSTETISPSPTEKVSPSPTEKVSPSSTKKVLPSPTEKVSPSPTEKVSPSATETDSPSATETGSPSTIISPAEKYEQKIIQVQAICTQDMNEVLRGAELSIEQLDRTNPLAVQTWKENLTKEIAAAESQCDGKFEEVSRNAVNDSVLPRVIEEWKQNFKTMKEKLQSESEAKLQKLLIS
jgi:hypothetical protein